MAILPAQMPRSFGAVTADTSVNPFMRAVEQRRQKERFKAQMLLRRRQQEENERANLVGEEQSRGFMDIQRAQNKRAETDAALRRIDALAASGQISAEDAAKQKMRVMGAEQVSATSSTAPATPPAEPQPAGGTISQRPGVSQVNPGDMDAYRQALAAPAGQGDVRGSLEGMQLPRETTEFTAGGAPDPRMIEGEPRGEDSTDPILGVRRTGPMQYRTSEIEIGGKPGDGETMAFLPPFYGQEPETGTRYRMPDGSIVTVDPEGQRQAAKDRIWTGREELMRSLGDYDGDDPRIKNAYGLARRALAMGVKPDTVYTNLNDTLERVGTDASRLEAAKLKKRGSGGAGGSGGPGKGRVLPRKLLNDARQLAKDVLGQHDYKGTSADHQKFKQLLSGFSSKNPAAQKVAQGSFVKMAQGGAGIISESDMDVFWHKLGAIDIQTADKLSQALWGDLGDEKRKIAMQASKELLEVTQARIDEIRDAMRRSFDASMPGATDWAMTTYFGESQNPLVKAAQKKSGGASRAQKPQTEAEWKSEAEALIGESQ